MSTSRILLSLAACLTLTTIVSAGDEPTLEQRLEKLEVALEAARIDTHIPGMSIAIVKDDEIIWMRFGQRGGEALGRALGLAPQRHRIDAPGALDDQAAPGDLGVAGEHRRDLGCSETRALRQTRGVDRSCARAPSRS